MLGRHPHSVMPRQWGRWSRDILAPHHITKSSSKNEGDKRIQVQVVVEHLPSLIFERKRSAEKNIIGYVKWPGKWETTKTSVYVVVFAVFIRLFHLRSSVQACWSFLRISIILFFSKHSLPYRLLRSSRSMTCPFLQIRKNLHSSALGTATSTTYTRTHSCGLEQRRHTNLKTNVCSDGSWNEFQASTLHFDKSSSCTLGTE